MRINKQIELKNVALVKEQLLFWGNQFRECVVLDSNSELNINQHYETFDFVLAVEAFTSIQTDYVNGFEKLNEYQKHTKDWLFGYLTYDLKNDIENLISTNQDQLFFPDLFFFQPKKLFILKGNLLTIKYLNLCEDELEIDWTTIKEIQPYLEEDTNKIEIQPRISKDKYLEKVNKMLSYIYNGDIYEANFCQEFFSNDSKIEPLKVFNNLNLISQAPFTTYFKNKNWHVLSASPERYLKRIENKIISQPIKGTSKRGVTIEEDIRLKEELKSNPKEQAENVMIVDLVRNDLSHTATKGSVQVEELFGIYTFKQAHQMISTITCEVDDVVPSVEVLKTTFPMGSMTGAPKISAMKIIEALEETKRGIYSGAIGYFEPNGNFDFNVIIRSILYNSDNKYVSFSVGSAITSNSVPEKEYEECLIKADAMLQVLI